MLIPVTAALYQVARARELCRQPGLEAATSTLRSRTAAVASRVDAIGSPLNRESRINATSPLSISPSASKQANALTTRATKQQMYGIHDNPQSNGISRAESQRWRRLSFERRANATRPLRTEREQAKQAHRQRDTNMLLRATALVARASSKHDNQRNLK